MYCILAMTWNLSCQVSWGTISVPAVPSAVPDSVPVGCRFYVPTDKVPPKGNASFFITFKITHTVIDCCRQILNEGPSKILKHMNIDCSFDSNIHNHISKLPVILYLHGGGWTLGDTGAYHTFCTEICHRTGGSTHTANRCFCITFVCSGLAVVSADYRRAPEHPCPAAAIDAYTCFSWLVNVCIVCGSDWAFAFFVSRLRKT
jgi:acetyl esterase/lipase